MSMPAAKRPRLDGPLFDSSSVFRATALPLFERQLCEGGGGERAEEGGKGNGGERVVTKKWPGGRDRGNGGERAQEGGRA